MKQRLQLELVFHGSIILLIGMLLGIPYAGAIVHGWGDEAVRAWRVAHVGESAAGLSLIAVGGIVALLALEDGAMSVLVWSLIASGYAFTVGLPLAAISGQRGLEAGGPLANWIVVAAYAVAALGAFVAIGLVIRGSRAALRRL